MKPLINQHNMFPEFGFIASVSTADLTSKTTNDKDIFVFGSNRQGRHGKGAALTALKSHGAIYGQAKGPQGSSYGIVTKELRWYKPSITLDEIQEQVTEFKAFAEANPTNMFLVTAIGCGLAGFQPCEIAPMFSWAFGSQSPNVSLPWEFAHYFLTNN